jgi:8-oxo-dGTP pyrophosphatase MutT (NUDIX family)
MPQNPPCGGLQSGVALLSLVITTPRHQVFMSEPVTATIALRESCMQQPNAEKVTAFVTRATPDGMDLLVFEHPRAGFQLPAGTVEANEPHAEAAAREAREETGLLDLPPGRFLSAVQQTLPDDLFLITSTTRVYSRPDLTSFDWASIRNGILVRVHHVGPAFAHVTYAERDPHTEPAAVSFQITGWVPASVITRQVTRFFYHFPYHGQTPATWSVDTDNDRFRLFWAPLNQLPPIVAPQRWWVDILTQCLPRSSENT